MRCNVINDITSKQYPRKISRITNYPIGGTAFHLFIVLRRDVVDNNDWIDTLSFVFAGDVQMFPSTATCIAGNT